MDFWNILTDEIAQTGRWDGGMRATRQHNQPVQTRDAAERMELKERIKKRHSFPSRLTRGELPSSITIGLKIIVKHNIHMLL